MALTRESIRDGFVQRMAAESGYGDLVLSQAELDASRDRLLAAVPPDSDVWVFGYGSLIWNPAFHFVERRIARVHGFHRRFCLWTYLSRGTPERPGLLLGLDRGGSCQGVAFRIAAPAVREELAILWRREMVTGAYRPRWITVELAPGDAQTATGAPGRSPAITFAINRDYPRYAGRLEQARVVQVLAEAGGPVGDCAEYLFNTVAHLDALGIHDPHLHALRAAVRQRRAAPGVPPADPAAAAQAGRAARG